MKKEPKHPREKCGKPISSGSHHCRDCYENKWAVFDMDKEVRVKLAHTLIGQIDRYLDAPEVRMKWISFIFNLILSLWGK